MEALRLITVDDEARIRTSLIHILEMHCPEVTVVAQADGVAAGVEAIRQHRPDVVLLDVQMGDGTGFDLLKQLMPLNFRVIFVTAHDTYAVQAFKFSALDYLLKPVVPEDLVAALQKAGSQIHASNLDVKLNTFIHNMDGLTRDSKKIVLNTQETIHVINITDIVRCEADRNYTLFVIAGGKSILVSGSLIEYDEMLSPWGFFRSHHSHLVNLSYIDKFEKRDGGRLILKDGSEAPVSVRRKDDLIAAIHRI